MIVYNIIFLFIFYIYVEQIMEHHYPERKKDMFQLAHTYYTSLKRSPFLTISNYNAFKNY